MTTTPPRNKYADFENLRTQAIALRREGLSRRQIRDRIHVDNNDLLNRLLDGEPAPEWTKRPNAKDDLREKARELRLKGMTYDEIQVELGCSKGSISLWVRDLPKPERKRSTEEASAIAKRGWEATMQRRERERQDTHAQARAGIGAMSERELFLVGVGLYWAEGSKSKIHRPLERVTFVNSDPRMIQIFLAWLKLVEVTPDQVRFYVHAHESADVSGIEHFWSDFVGVDFAEFGKTTLKKHNPKTNRKNTNDAYRGCLVIQVRQSAALYRRIEGWFCGIVDAAPLPDQQNRT
ncbi:hypothetical protein OG897_04545 [Streptomyces sp. NBC_00237]|uniref:hypothetical protein n=1 Tax=Streptomyces sp. NBC_00237 TaxID=2975687 RepID=UPI00224DE480|nr:hypothetical protein [Streptomyces sp. NBC_00237]MCX5200734.1 hypothetical protein [Streptomyces sp. NBC_00237]